MKTYQIPPATRNINTTRNPHLGDKYAKLLEKLPSARRLWKPFKKYIKIIQGSNFFNIF